MKENKTLGKLVKGKNTNITIIKFILAILVIFSHSFPIALGIKYVDPLATITRGQISFGNLSVCIFLFYGGFLIAKSLEKNNDFLTFFKKRIKRIFPPLILMLLFTVLIIGPIFSGISVFEYFENSAWLKYFLKNSLLITTHNITGVFEKNIYYQSINGSLWTLPVEFLCYIGGFIAFKIGLSNKKILKYTLIPFLLVIIFKNTVYSLIPSLASAFPLLFFFYIGMIYYIYRDEIVLSNKYFILCLILLVISLSFNIYSYVSVFLISYIVIYISYYFKQNTLGIKKIFSLSYEIYLLGFLMQQVIVYLFGGTMNPYLNFIIASVLTIMLAYPLNYFSDLLSNKIFEKGVKIK